jgi:hypothetical protein
LLNDFNEETFSEPLSTSERKQLIAACMAQVERIHQQNSQLPIIVCSDSTTFANEAKTLSYVSVIPGNVSHIGNDTVRYYQYYEKTFLDFYRADIRTYFPAFSAETFDGDTAYFVYYDLNPVGLTMGKRQENGELELCLDYAIPKYRDASVGRFLYPHLLGDEGFSALTFPNCSDKHESYLKQMGFRKVGGCYRLEQ